MPAAYERYGESWQRHHPGWEMRLWTDASLPEIGLADELERGRTPAECSDVLRYELLRRFGGVYVDTDFECLRSIEPLLDGVEAFVALYKPQGRINNAIMGARPGHPAFQRAVAEVRSRVGDGPIKEATGPRFLARVIDQFPEVTIFESKHFYPSLAEDPPPETYAIHHASSTWKTEDEWREAVVRLQRRLARSERAREAAKAQSSRLEYRLELARGRVAEMERSRWWRLGQGLSRLVGGGRR